MNEIIDFTKYRKGTKPGGYLTIEYCPKCGRKGEAATYRDGDRRYFHKVEAGRFGVSIKESCYIRKDEADNEN